MSRHYEKHDLEAALESSGISDAAALRIRSRLNDAATRPLGQDAASHRRYSYNGRSVLAAVGLFILLTSLMIVARSVVEFLAGLLVATVAFSLSSYFQRRGEGIPLVVLLAGTVSGIADTLLGLVASSDTGVAAGHPFEAWHSVIVFGGAALAAGAFWMVYRLPLAFATFMLMILILGGEVATMLVGAPSTWTFIVWPALFAMFALVLACWHDMSDVYRETPRSDVAFWLHAVGGATMAGQCFWLYEMVAHPGSPIATSPEQFTMISPAASGIGLAIFLSYVIYAICLDRLTMALIGTIFIMCSMQSLLGLDLFPITLMVTGGAALALAAMWQPIRHLALSAMPLIVRAQLPRSFSRVDGTRPVV